MASHHCTQEGADSYVGMAMLPKDRKHFEAHLVECPDGRCMKLLLEAEERLSSRPLADLVAAFLQAHLRRVEREVCYSWGVICAVVDGDADDPAENMIDFRDKVRKHLRTCNFCRAFASPFAGRSLRRALKEEVVETAGLGSSIQFDEESDLTDEILADGDARGEEVIMPGPFFSPDPLLNEATSAAAEGGEVAEESRPLRHREAGRRIEAEIPSAIKEGLVRLEGEGDKPIGPAEGKID
ncbi:hypothetical protein HY625_01935 [Candidatus Uhrbacteria bacterium]|nr:hypothetical protein [Candidatus Uhrbacteria bacterium]